MNRSIFLLMILSFSWCCSVTCGQEIGFVEQYALAGDREKVLNQLVPGTEDYYYFHSLFHQSRNEFGKVDQLLKDWRKRIGRTSRFNIIRNRQAFLRYSEDPAVTYQYLVDELKLDFSHQRRIPIAEKQLPSTLDPMLISTKRLIEKARKRYRDTQGIERSGLGLLDVSQLDRTELRHLLSRLEYPDFPGLAQAVVKDLQEKNSGGFGSLKIHRLMTIDQLEQCRTALPKLMGYSNFVNAYLRKLVPNDDVDWIADKEEHRKYLQRLREFTSKLNPGFNSLKACVLFRLLEFNREQGEYDRDLFVEYLKLPRDLRYVSPQLIKQAASRNHLVQLAADYRKQIRLSPVGSDEWLV
ncbi:MAG: hypothetical protein AAGA30_18815, partial [Planctomycetota bacterium]